MLLLAYTATRISMLPTSFFRNRSYKSTWQRQRTFLFMAGELSPPGLPDAIFSYQIFRFGYVLKGLDVEKCWSILWYFGIFNEHLVCYGYLVFLWYIFSRFGMFYKIWQPRSPTPPQKSVFYRIMRNVVKRFTR
jgi:hypothetical protein